MSDSPTRLTSSTAEVLESVWADIRSRTPDVIGDPVFVVKSDKRAWGHMTVHRTWSERLPDEVEGPVRRFHEIMLSAELMAQPVARILQTMIHEAAHTVASQRGVKDTSRQNRYHNSRFRAIAEEMGLEWAHVSPETVKVPGSKDRVLLLDAESGEAFDEDGFPFFEVEARPDDVIGYSDMHVSAETLRVYEDSLRNLETIRIKHSAPRAGYRAPKRRRTVCLVSADVTEGYEDRDAAEEACGEAFQDEEIQRLGVVVYEGLVARDLLAPHLHWIEV